MTNFIVWLAVGVVIGWLASRLMDSNQTLGWPLGVAVGILGACVAGWIVDLQLGADPAFNLPSMMGSVLGAVLVVSIAGLFRGGRARAR